MGMVLDYDFFHSSINNTESPGLVFILQEHDLASMGRGAWSNVPFLEKILHLVLPFLIF
jgi:hypothetical protein